MAYGHGNDDDYQQLGMFHMINGVNVKIGEKYKLPERISLPTTWRPADPSQLLSFKYDFWRENEVIRRAEEERQVHEAQMRNNEEVEDTPPEAPEDSCSAVKEPEEEADDTPNTSTESNTTEILTPLVFPSEGIENKVNAVEKKINIEEFEEDRNQNPFESVELQTLDNFDELRSVLEPSANPTAKGKTSKTQAEEPKTNENFELDANFFKKVDIATPVPSFVSGNYKLGGADRETTVSKPLTNNQDVFSMPYDISKATLNWTKFDTLRHGHPQPSSNVQCENQFSQPTANTHVNGQGLQYSVGSDVNLNLPNSITNGHNGPIMMSSVVPSGYNSDITSYTSSDPPTDSPTTETAGSKGMESASHENIALKHNLSYGQLLFMTDEIPRTKSLPELQGGSADQINNPGNAVSSGNAYPTDHANQVRSQDDNVVSTERIDSIMKQYQFQRLNNLPTASSYASSTSAQFSNVGGNMQPPQYVAPSSFAGESIPSNNNVPLKKMSNPLPQPFDPGTGTGAHSNAFSQANVNFNQMNAIPSPDFSNKQYNMMNQPPTSNFQMQSGGVHNTYPEPSSAAYPAENNPFMSTCVASQAPTQVPTSIYRRGVLPPLPLERSHLADNFTPVPPALNTTTFSNSNSSKLTETDLRVSQSPLLPSISPQDPPYPPVTTHTNTNGMTTVPVQILDTLSWLVDPTEDLLLHEKNFAYQIAAMGFPLPCVSRTIQRVGVDEKEVLDFLCSVQDLKEKDFHSDDVEMALVNLHQDKDKDKMTSYLQMVSTFRELGFKPLQIHNALRETSVDQNKALDYLTSSR